LVALQLLRQQFQRTFFERSFHDGGAMFFCAKTNAIQWQKQLYQDIAQLQFHLTTYGIGAI